jgi:predicted NBD/HSP70 family sugar kinase
MSITVVPKVKPPLDPGFVPASLWNRAFQQAVKRSGGGQKLAIALERPDESVSVFHTAVLRHEGEGIAANERYVERLVKFLLWQKGGYKVTIAGDPAIATHIRRVYSPSGERAFDYEFIPEICYLRKMQIEQAPYDQAPAARESSFPLGRHQDGCRIGFDLGGSDRKCAAVIDGQVIFTDEVAWDPYFKTDPQYHYDQINDSLKRAAAHLPRVDAIGGSSAGNYVQNEVRAASLFRGVPKDLFDKRIRPIFLDLQKEWNGVPFVVINDGEVTALGASMTTGHTAILGIAMGTSTAAGYVNPQGNVTNWLNELAFVPVDYRPDAPIDEWSKDGGVGSQYFSQQAVNRLLPAAGIQLPENMPLAEKLVEVQKLMAAGDARAREIYKSIGVYLGYALPQFADFYELSHVLVLGRVMTGEGGDIIMSEARKVLQQEFPEILERVGLHVPGEKEKRLGQAVAAASLPALAKA